MSIDPKTGKIIQDRVKDKINYQTSFTDFKIFYLYCKTFQKFGMLKENEINSILGRERKKIGSWDNDNDSHARITLLQYKLIGKISDDNYALTKIGKAFLSLFDTNGKITDNETSIYNVCFDMLVAWHQNNDDFDIHPGLLLLKLLLQPELHYYITDHDLACIFNNQNNKKDIQYNDIVRQIVEFRDSGRIYTKSELKKTYTILTGYANNWGIFSLLPRSNGTIKYVSLKDDFKKIAISRLNLLSEDRILSDEEFSGLVQNEINLSMAISHFESKYGKEGMIFLEQKNRASEIQKMYRNRLISLFGQKCLLCNITNKELLVASHIKSFVACDSIAEKIDNNNGFLLCANHDKLFDRFLITFNARNGKIRISTKLTKEDISACDLKEDYSLPVEILTIERQKYLMWHNAEFEKKERQYEQ